MALLIGIMDMSARIYAAVKFFRSPWSRRCFMLAGIIWLYAQNRQL